MIQPLDSDDVIRRHALAVERIERQLREVTTALDEAGVPYAVIGGNAVAAWVATIDPDAIRTTKDVDLLVNRADLGRLEAALRPLGYSLTEVLGVWMFLPADRPNPRNGVHLIFAGEPIKEGDSTPAPSVESAVPLAARFRVLDLHSLVRMKLQAFRRRDQVHLTDMLELGLIDAGWVSRFEPALAARLKELFENPD